jgi:hypothetical protein
MRSGQRRRRKKKPILLSPLEKAEAIIPYPSLNNPFPQPDFRAPYTKQIKRRKNSLKPINIYTHPSNNQSNGTWAIDIVRIVYDLQLTKGIMSSVFAAEIVQKTYRLRRWKMQMKKKFQILVHHRKMWEHKKSITIQCMIRKKQATNKVKRKRFQYHTEMSKKIQTLGRWFNRNQKEKKYLRTKVLQLIATLIPSGRVSTLLKREDHSYSRRRNTFSHRGSITEEELDILKELADVALRLMIHSTLFVELLDCLRWTQFIARSVRTRHVSYQNRRTFSSSLCKRIISSIIKDRIFNIEKRKIDKMFKTNKLQHTIMTEKKRERMEREYMFHEEHLQLKMKMLKEKQIESIRLKHEQMKREHFEVMWRKAMLKKKVELFNQEKLSYIQNMMQFNIDQGIYLAKLTMNGERNTRKIKVSNAKSSIQVVYGKRVRVYFHQKGGNDTGRRT